MGEGTAFFIFVVTVLFLWWCRLISTGFACLAIVLAALLVIVVSLVERILNGQRSEENTRDKTETDRDKQHARQEKQRVKHPKRYAKARAPQSIDLQRLTARHHTDWQTIIDQRAQQTSGGAGHP